MYNTILLTIVIVLYTSHLHDLQVKVCTFEVPDKSCLSNTGEVAVAYFIC